jgi:hyperosmotically inducible periplasmic protein
MSAMKTMLSAAIVGGLIAAGAVGAGCTSTRTQESTGEYVDSSVVTAKVKAALIKDPMLDGLAIGVDTFKDRVSLSGFVDNTAQKERATVVASSVNGVKKVENNLVVK